MFNLLSAKSSLDLMELLSSYEIKTLGTTFVINGTFYQSFLGELKESKVTESKPEVTESKPEVTESKPKVTRKSTTKRKTTNAKTTNTKSKSAKSTKPSD